MKETTKQQYEVPVLEELEVNNFQVVMGDSITPDVEEDKTKE